MYLKFGTFLWFDYNYISWIVFGLLNDSPPPPKKKSIYFTMFSIWFIKCLIVTFLDVFVITLGIKFVSSNKWIYININAVNDVWWGEIWSLDPYLYTFKTNTCITLQRNKLLVSSIQSNQEKNNREPFDFLIKGKNVLVTLMVPKRLTSATRRYKSSVRNSTSPYRSIPALFTTPHSPGINVRTYHLDCC